MRAFHRPVRKKRIKRREFLPPPCRAEHLRKVVLCSKAAFYEGEAGDVLTGAEFLFQQAGYIRQRFWVLQGIVLAVLWIFLRYVAAGGLYTQRMMGIAAPLFGVLLLPELWKNRTANAMEVEGTAYYSLRQIYAARMFLFALVDVLMLTVFFLAAVGGGRIVLEEIMIQFFLPLTVTCCICFRSLSVRRAGTEVFAMFLCLLWSVVWLQFLLLENLYEKVAVPVWYGILAAAVFYLVCCVRRGLGNCREIWEEKEAC